MRLIDADRLKRQVEGRSWKARDKFVELIDNAPTIEVEPVKRGKWIYDNQFHWYRASCSECGYKRVTDIKAEKWNGWKYCPNCGAKMEDNTRNNKRDTFSK